MTRIIGPSCSRLLAGAAALSTSAAAQVRPIDTRIDAVFGRPVILRVQPTERSLPPSISVRLDDGRELEAELAWVRATWNPDQAAPNPWLGPFPQLTPVPPRDPAVGTGQGSWILRLHYPLASAGQGFWIRGERYEVHWTPDPLRLANGRDADPWQTPLTPDQLANPLLQSLIAPAQNHPLVGWRYDLALGTLAPQPEFDPPEPAGPIDDLDALRAELLSPTPERTIIDDIAAVERARWQVALAQLHELDPALAARTRELLAGAVQTPPGYLPIWFANDPELADLLSIALDHSSPPEARKNRLQAWLSAFPTSLAWVLDDAGWQGALRDELRPTVALLNLAPRPVLAWARELDDASTNDLAPLPVRQLAALRAAIAQGRNSRAANLGPGAEILVDGRLQYLPVIGSIIPVTPPGFPIGPLRSQWALDRFIQGDEVQGTPVAPDAQTAAILLRTTTIQPELMDSVGPGEPIPVEQWLLHIEARAPAIAAGPSQHPDRVELWFGPFGTATRVLHIYPDGRVINGLTNQPAPAANAHILRLNDRWIARVPIPQDALESDGILRVGIIRRDSFGGASSWPRRLLPGQLEPGRIALQTRTWDGFRTVE